MYFKCIQRCISECMKDKFGFLRVSYTRIRVEWENINMSRHPYTLCFFSFGIFTLMSSRDTPKILKNLIKLLTFTVCGSENLKYLVPEIQISEEKVKYTRNFKIFTNWKKFQKFEISNNTVVYVFSPFLIFFFLNKIGKITTRHYIYIYEEGYFLLQK